ncbi:MAG: DUF4430 domain-containing protein [Thermoleophilaceae bacterium]
MLTRKTLAAGCAAACSLAVAGPAVANHLDPVASLRVEGVNQVLAPGSSYVAGPERIVTDEDCGGSGRTVSLREPTALGLLEQGTDTNRRLRPLGVSDEFDFGLLVCRIADLTGSDTGFWLYKVDHSSPEVGADQREIEDGDEVLWYFSDTARGVNTGDELVIEAPARAEPDEPFEVRVLAYDAAGNRTAAAGAQVHGRTVVTTGADGRATIEPEQRGRRRLRAVRGGDIPSTPVVVCVGSEGGCAAKTTHRIVGTNGDDVFRGTSEADRILARGGDDRIDVRGGGRDIVDCGSGDDVVHADRDDRVGRSCERVRRR